MRNTILAAFFCLFISSPTLADFSDGIKAFQAKNYQKAYEEWYPLAVQGKAEAQSNLGLLYDLGLGIEQNLSEAQNWYQKAAKQRDTNAQYNLGVIYFQGKGVVSDFSKARKWFLKSAQKGHANAQNNLGWLYEKGLGVEKNLQQAKNWYQKAANKKLPLAQKNLVRLKQQSHQNKPHFVMDIEWLHNQLSKNYTLQLASSKSLDGLKVMRKKTYLKEAKIVPQRRANNENHVMLLHSISNKSEIKQLAAEIESKLGIKPWIRKISGVKKYLPTEAAK
ncbi:SPOR domain-containing protein [uncultured Thiomicrorhabdus sp.]